MLFIKKIVLVFAIILTINGKLLTEVLFAYNKVKVEKISSYMELDSFLLSSDSIGFTIDSVILIGIDTIDGYAPILSYEVYFNDSVTANQTENWRYDREDDSVYFNFDFSPIIYTNIDANERTLVPSQLISTIYNKKTVDTEGSELFYEGHNTRLHKRGYSWHIYSMKLPMAWEITKGNDSTIIMQADEYEEKAGFDPLTRSDDIRIKESIGEDGNWLYSNSNSYDGIGHYDLKISPGHGLATLPSAISRIDNDNLEDFNTGNPQGALIGSCPKCSGVANEFNSIGKQHWNEDYDFKNNNWDRQVSVLGQSNTSNPGGNVFYNMYNGIVTVSSTGNGFLPSFDKIDCSMTYGSVNGGEKTIEIEKSYEIIDGTTYDIYTISPNQALGLGQGVHPNTTDPTKDVRSISVGAYMDGEFEDKNCNWWYGSSSTSGPNFKGDSEQFPFAWYYSIGTDKFYAYPRPPPASNNEFIRARTKANATIDVVAPGFGIISMQPVLNKELNIVQEWEDKVYSVNSTGTSFSSPLVSGVVGLQLSINPYVGVELGSDSRPINGLEVQRKVYDIITFTADKIIDANRDYPDIICGTKIIRAKKPDQPQYIEQFNDELKRWWAQRVGFGKVNSYRILAHTIENKAEYTYNSTGTLTFANDDGAGDWRGYKNEDGVQLMHMGSKVREWDGTGTQKYYELNQNRGPNVTYDSGDLDVIEWGGVSYPQDPVNYNNAGVTVLEDSETDIQLFVGNNQLLAIDGIITNPDIDMNHKISTTGTGRILIEGQMEDVELTGSLRISDLVIDGTVNDAISCIYMGGGTGYNSKVYGELEMINYGMAFCSGADVTFYPGSNILMSGEKDFVITNYSNVFMMSGSGASENKTLSLDRSIVVKNNGELIIEEKAKVELLCSLNVKDNGIVTLKKNSIVTLDQFHIEPGGTLILEEGVHLILNENSLVEGKMIIKGTIDNKVVISGSVKTNCFHDVIKEFDDDNTLVEEYIDNSVTIKAVGDNGEIDDSKIDFKFARFYEVKINGINIPIEQMKGIDYFTNSRLDLSNFTRFSLAIEFDNPIYRFTDSLSTVVIDSCQFIDLNDSTLINLRFDMGAYIKSASGVTIKDSYFNNLLLGAITSTCDRVSVTTNLFKENLAGYIDMQSTPFICNNEFEITRTAVELVKSFETTVCDNIFDVVEKGVSLDATAHVGFRGNQFNNFFRGINADQSIAFLRGKVKKTLTCGFNRDITDLGRNEFILPNPYFIINPFFSNNNDPKYSDIYLNFPESGAVVQCGKNNFSEYSSNHIFYQKRFGGDPNKSIDCEVNDWNDVSGHLVRYNSNLSITQPIANNTSETRILGCDLGTKCECNYFPSDVLCDNGTTYYNDGFLIKITRVDSFLNTVNDSSRSYMFNNFYSAPCRKSYMFDALQSTTLGLGAQSKLSTITVEYDSLFNDTTLATDLRINALFLKAQALERLDSLADANFNYSLVSAVFPTERDTMRAKWKQMEVIANLNTGDTRDSLLSVFVNKLVDDIRVKYDTTGYALKRVDSFTNEVENKIDKLYQNNPNPFGESTNIKYYIADDSNVEIKVYNNEGKLIISLVDKHHSKGEYNLQFNIKNLTQGVYYYTLSTKNGNITKEMMLVK